MPATYRTNEKPPGSIVEVGLRTPDAEFLKRGIQTLAESAECLGGQIGSQNDLSGALRAALLVDHLTRNYAEVFANLPRWQNDRVPADLGMLVVQVLHKLVKEGGGNPYLYQGLDDVQKAMENNLLVQRFLKSAARSDSPK